jgi:hypothetical protein
MELWFGEGVYGWDTILALGVKIERVQKNGLGQ